MTARQPMAEEEAVEPSSETANDPVPAAPGARQLIQDHGWDANHMAHECFGEILAMLGAASEPIDFLAWTLPIRHDLHHHIIFEDEGVLPVAAEVLTDVPPNGEVEVFLEDHRLIRERLDRLFDIGLQGVYRTVDAALPRECLAVLMDLLDHHDQREVEHLYGPLGETLGAVRRQGLLDLLAETSMVTAEQAGEVIDGWKKDGLIHKIGHHYGAWVDGGELDETEDPSLTEVIGSEAPAYLKLRQRDLELVKKYRSASFEKPEEWLQAWRRTEQTLRTTVRYALEAAFEHAVGLPD